MPEYRRDNLNTSRGGNAIDCHVFTRGSLMPRRWQPHPQDRAGKLIPCLFRNLTVFRRSKRMKSRTDYLLMNQCSQARTRIGQYNARTLYQKVRLAQLNKIMGEYELAVLGISEVRWNGNGRTETTNGNIFVYSGMPTLMMIT